MSRSMHGPWIKNCLMGMLAGEESYSAHQTRCVQVTAVKPDARVLLISDTEIAINAFLTEECFNELVEIYPIETIKQSQINLSEFYFSTVSQAAGNMDMEFLRKLGICPPFALHCFKVDYLGASDSTTIGKPSDVNQSHALIGELRKFKYADLLDRLAERQYPLPRLLKTLPDWEGTFIADFTAVPVDQPLQSSDFVEPEVQSRLIEAIDSFDIRHTLEVLPALLLDEAGNLGETQVSSVPRLVPTTRSQNQTSGSSGAKGKAHNSTQHTQEATAGWSETMREDDDYDAYLSLLQSNNPYSNGYAHTWDPLGDSQLTPDADPNVSNMSGNKNKINDFSYPDSESDEDNQKNGADDMEIIPRETPRNTQTNARGVNNTEVYHRLDTGTQSSQLDEHMLFSQPILTSAITEIVEGRSTRSRHNTLTDVALPLTGSSTSTTTTSTTSHSTTLNTTAPPLTVSPPLAQRSQHSTQSSVSDKHTASTLSTLAGVDLLQSSQSQHSLNTHHSANSKHSSASKGRNNSNSRSSTEVRVVRTNADGQVMAVEVQRVDPAAAALSVQQLLQASQAAPITSPVEDRPYRPNGNGNGTSAKSKKHAPNRTKDNSGSESESSDSSSGDSDGLPRGIKVVPLTPLDMVQPITSNTHEKHPSFSTQYLQEQRYITQPSQRDLLYSAASGNLSGNSVSDFTISQGEDEAVENVNTSNVTHNSTQSSSSSNGVKNSAVKYSAASAVHTTMGPPSTIRSPLPHTNNTHTASNSATQSTPNKRYTSNSGTSSGGMTSSHPAETQSYQSPSQLSQSAPIVMINNNTSQGNDMVRKGAPVVMTRYKLREKEEIKELEQAEALVGQQVNKKFNGTFYLGTVKTYDAESKLFHIVYEDGDEEDLVMREINRWLYRPDVQQQPQSSRKTRRNDPTPIPTPTPVATSSAGAEPAIVSTTTVTGTATATASNNTRSSATKALRTVPEEEQGSQGEEGEEESEGELTQPQFVTQPELTQPVVQITRATRSRMSSTEALLYSQANESEIEGTPAVSTRNKHFATTSTRVGIAGMSMEDIRDTPHSLKRFAAELLDGESMRKAPRHQSTTTSITATAAATASTRTIPFVPTHGAVSAASHNISDSNSISEAEAEAEEGPTSSTAAATSHSTPITLSYQEVQLLSDAQLLDYFNTLSLPAGFAVPNVSDYGYNIYNMLRALPGLIAEYMNDLRIVTASHKKGAKGNAPKPVVHKVSSPPRYGSLTLKSTRSGAVDTTKAAATSSKQNVVPQHSTSSIAATAVSVTVSVTTVPVPVISVADLTDVEIKQQYPNPSDARRVRMQRAVELSQRKK
eukprot:gene7961-9491_t